eukprot:582868-Pyramimonas_sp.AAC.1
MIEVSGVPTPLKEVEIVAYDKRSMKVAALGNVPSQSAGHPYASQRFFTERLRHLTPDRPHGRGRGGGG